MHTELLIEDEAESVPLELIEPLMRSTVIATARDDGWSSLSALGSMLNRVSPSFDSRIYGCSKLSALIRKLPYLEIQESPSTKNTAQITLSVRLKDN